jgi:hypothetical protein
VEPHVAERCLNHKLKGLEGGYNRHDYFKARRRALEAWGQLLLKLEGGDAIVKSGKAKSPGQPDDRLRERLAAHRSGADCVPSNASR